MRVKPPSEPLIPTRFIFNLNQAALVELGRDSLPHSVNIYAIFMPDEECGIYEDLDLFQIRT
jgi:hypothetical protein